MLQNYLAPTSIFIIVVFFFIFRNHPKHKYILPTILSSLGILGTFIGIAIGLYTFDVNNIDQSVPTLLQGLKLAFVSSIAGIIFTIIKKFELSREEKIEESSEEYQDSESDDSKNIITILQDILEQNDYSEKLDELSLKLSGENNQTIGFMLNQILQEINLIKVQSDDNKTPQNLEEQIKELLESNKNQNEDLKLFINNLSSSIGIELDTADNQKQIITLLQEILSKDTYGAKLDELNSKLGSKNDLTTANLLEKINNGLDLMQSQAEKFQEDQTKLMKFQFKEFIKIIHETNEELKESLDKLTLIVAESSKEVLPGIEQNMSSFSQELGQTMLEATEKMSKSFEKKSAEADEAGKWQVRSVIELQEMNQSIKKLIKEADNQSQNITDNNKKLIFALKSLLNKEDISRIKKENLEVI